jgi:AAA-like domain/TIR domain
MGDSIRASERGLELIDIARKRKGWTKSSTQKWLDDAQTTRSTLNRFWNRTRINRDTFIAICAAVGFPNWQEIADLTPEPLDPKLEADYRRATGELSDPPKTVSIIHSDRSASKNAVQQVEQNFQDAGCQTFVSGDDRHQELTWTQKVDSDLQQSDLVVLVLDRDSAKSEMMTEVVRRAKESDRQPEILPIFVDLPHRGFVNPELFDYIQQNQLFNWNSQANNRNWIQDVVQSIVDGQTWPIIQNAIPPIPAATSTDMMPPLPSAPPELELPNGQVALTSRFYIPRPPKETQALEIVTQPGALIRIRAPRQMGKTSLMARLLAHAEQQGYHKVSLSFQRTDADVFTDLDRLLRWFCASIGKNLKLANRVDEYWDDIFGSKDNCTAYFEEYLLTELDAPLVLGLDEVDRVFQYPAIAGDFFGLLRAWHEDAKNREIWRKLHLVVVHSTEVYVPMDLNQSPFNVGFSVELQEFFFLQVEALARLHGLNWQSDRISQLMEMVGGHPYLVRVALYHLAKGDLSLAEFSETAHTESGLYRDHLHYKLWKLKQYPELAEAMKEAIASSTPIRLDPTLGLKLDSMGLVKLKDNTITPRYQLYRQYFQNFLGIN